MNSLVVLIRLGEDRLFYFEHLLLGEDNIIKFAGLSLICDNHHIPKEKVAIVPYSQVKVLSPVHLLFVQVVKGLLAFVS
jgi:hypothetical protein